MVSKYHGRGNVIECAYFDASGKSCLNQFGFAEKRRKYDERSNLIEEAYFDTSGKPCLRANQGLAGD
jgi:hypothetical protein